MIRTLALVLLILIVGYAIIWGCVALYYKLKREEDADLQHKKEITRELQDATEDLKDEQARMQRRKERENA